LRSMPISSDPCWPLWQTAIVIHNSKGGVLGAPGNFRERGRGLRRRSLVATSLRAVKFNSRCAPGPGPQRVEVEFWGSEPHFSSSSALVSSASGFHCRSATVSCRAEREESVLGFFTAKRAVPALMSFQGRPRRRNTRDVSRTGRFSELSANFGV
jgi:hypothetical protein